MNSIRVGLASASAALMWSAPVSAETVKPLHFFEGRTETVGTIKIIMKKPYRTHSIGRGVIQPDGSLLLVQRVEDEGQPARERRWHIRQTGPGHYSGAMTEAVGPVTIDEVDGNYRFRFKMKGNLAVEQWLKPLPGGLSARNTVKVRKYGMTVGSSDGTVSRLGGR